MKRGASPSLSSHAPTKHPHATVDTSHPLPLLPKDVQLKIFDYVVWNNPHNTPIWSLCKEVHAYFVQRRHAYRARICLLYVLSIPKLIHHHWMFTTGESIINDYCAYPTPTYRLYTIRPTNDIFPSTVISFVLNTLHLYLPHVPMYMITDDLVYCTKNANNVFCRQHPSIFHFNYIDTTPVVESVPSIYMFFHTNEDIRHDDLAQTNAFLAHVLTQGHTVIRSVFGGQIPTNIPLPDGCREIRYPK